MHVSETATYCASRYDDLPEIIKAVVFILRNEREKNLGHAYRHIHMHELIIQIDMQLHTGAGTRDSSWILNICPNFRAAPRILHNARAKRSAFLSDKYGERACWLFSELGVPNKTLFADS